MLALLSFYALPSGGDRKTRWSIGDNFNRDKRVSNAATFEPSSAAAASSASLKMHS